MIVFTPNKLFKLSHTNLINMKPFKCGLESLIKEPNLWSYIAKLNFCAHLSKLLLSKSKIKLHVFEKFPISFDSHPINQSAIEELLVLWIIKYLLEVNDIILIFEVRVILKVVSEHSKPSLIVLN